MNKIAIYLTKKELSYLEHILWHFTDYMAGDNREDHGFGILKGYRELNDEDKRIIYEMSGTLRRRHRKMKKDNKYA